MFWAPMPPISFFLFSIFLFSNIYFRSKILKPSKWNVSLSNMDLTCLSKGLELDREGKTLTSSNHGFKA